MMRWGILGTARINRRVIPAMRATGRSELVAVASRTLARGEAYAREWAIPRAVEGYQTLLDSSGIDAVYIPLPNSEHVPWTLATIAAGKHVLCEKPIALDPVDVDRIADAASRAGVVVEEGFMYRHEPMTARVIALIAEGAIGTVRTIVSGFTFALQNPHDVRLDATLGGGSLWDVGCYPVTYAQLIVGRAPMEVLGTAHWTASGVDDEFTGVLRFDTDTTASIYSGFRGEYHLWLQAVGATGVLTVPHPFRPGPLETLVIDRAGRLESIVVPGSTLLFQREIEDFEAAVLDGAPPVVSLAESRRTIATLAALTTAARKVGQPLHVAL